MLTGQSLHTMYVNKGGIQSVNIHINTLFFSYTIQ